MNDSSQAITRDIRPEPTLLETELDSICMTLSRMKSRLHRVPMLDHLSDSERNELHAALLRAQDKMQELDTLIRAGGNA